MRPPKEINTTGLSYLWTDRNGYSKLLKKIEKRGCILLKNLLL